MKRTLGFFLVLGITAAIAGAIKTWAPGDTLTAGDLNATFQHIHNSMVGGHGARLVDSDVSASAAISHSKMATPGLLPRAWGIWKTACVSPGPCATTVDIGISDAVFNATGDYCVRLDVGRTDANFAVFVTPFAAGGADTACATYSHSTGTTFGSFCFKCFTAGVAANTAFQVMVLDDN